jgi:hypothetical protein
MKVYLEAPFGLSRAMTRVSIALGTNVPSSVEVVRDQKSADLVVLHVVGFPDTEDAIQKLKLGQKYALIQYCLRTTQRPEISSWVSMWKQAEIVWSYYDLYRLALDERIDPSFNFYHSPLGVNSSVFEHLDTDKKTFGILTSGYIADTECSGEAAAASRTAGYQHCHLGPNLHLGPGVSYHLGISDIALAKLYRQSRLVTGLRRVEGFELPAAEAILCGTRSVVFDKPHYRKWFEPWSIFIQEAAPQCVTKALVNILREGVKPVSKQERQDAANQFDWSSISRGFWTTLLGRIAA